MNEESSVSLDPVSCAGCQATSESREGWLIRPTEEGEVALCPACTLQAQQELDQQGVDINLSGAVLYGFLVAMVSAGLWYGIVVVTDYKLGIAAVGLGWLVGKAVVLGAGDKRSATLQLAGGLLALLGLVVGEYLIVNHMARLAIEEFSGWLTLDQFLIIYPAILADGNWLLDVVFYLIALYEGAIQPRPLKLHA